MSFGFQNLGNTCYMASVLQALLSVDPLNDYFKQKVCGHKLLQEYINLVKKLDTDSKIVYPIDFHKSVQNLALRRGNTEFNGYKQCDSHEFLIFLLDSMHEYLKKPVEIEIDGVSENKEDDIALEAMNSWKIYYEKGYSRIIEYLGGQYYSKVIKDDGSVSNNFDPFTNLFLEIPTNTIYNISIYDLFDNFTKTETITDYERTSNVKRETCFWELPEYLIINLKRFNMSTKITTKVDFPIINLDLRKYIQGYNEEEGLFDLVSVVNHSGTLHGGHYYSYCLRNGKWLNFNDSNVTNILRKDICTNNAYCLFYKKKSG